MNELYAEFGYASLPAIGHSESGDRILVQQTPSYFALLLIDVAGHGATASRVAHSLVWPNMEGEDPPSSQGLLQSIHHQLAGSVGAAGLAVVFCFKSKRFLHTSVGSIRLHHSRLGALESRAGHLGVRNRAMHEKTDSIESGDVLIACTDGVQNRGLAAHIEQLSGSAYVQAGTLLRRQNKNHDDATVALVRVGTKIVDR